MASISLRRQFAKLSGGGRGSGAYDAIRGAEHLYHERAVQAGVAADQIAPIRAGNPNAERYIGAALEMDMRPCQ